MFMICPSQGGGAFGSPPSSSYSSSSSSSRPPRSSRRDSTGDRSTEGTPTGADASRCSRNILVKKVCCIASWFCACSCKRSISRRCRASCSCPIACIIISASRSVPPPSATALSTAVPAPPIGAASATAAAPAAGFSSFTSTGRLLPIGPRLPSLCPIQWITYCPPPHHWRSTPSPFAFSSATGHSDVRTSPPSSWCMNRHDFPSRFATRNDSTSGGTCPS